MCYGDNGLDPSQTVKVGESQQICDISRIVNRLNLNFEMTEEKKHIPKRSSRISLLKSIEKKSGAKNLYKGWTIDQLNQRLESLELYNI